MKKVIIVTLTMLFFIVAKANDKGVAFIEQSFEPQQLSIDNDIKATVSIVLDPYTDVKFGKLKFTKTSSIDYASASMTLEEITGFIEYLNYIKEHLLPTVPELHTNTVYVTSDHIKFEGYYNNNDSSWKLTFYCDCKYPARFGIDGVDSLLQILIDAKNQIEESLR